MFRFENPDLLHLLWALPLFGGVLYVYWEWRQRTLRQLGSPQLAERLLLGFSARRFWVKIGFYAAALALIAVAVANPRQAVRVTPPAQKGADILIALDISQSMLARDVAPSRLEEAKTFIQKLVQSLEGDRVGLIFFAGDAFPQMPLSTDHSALLTFVRNANPGNTTEQGSDMGTAIQLAGRLFGAGGQAGRALVLVSDGENHLGEPVRRAREVHNSGVQIHTVTVGTTTPTTIPLNRREVKRDFSGQPVRTSADPSLLSDVAQTGGGLAVQAGNDGAVTQLTQALGRLTQTAVEAKAYTEYVSYFQWLLLPAIILLILEQIMWWKRKNQGI